MDDAREIRHGYGLDPSSRPHDALEGSFAYHLRRHREAYGKHGLSQRALAMLAHVSRSVVVKLEETTVFQSSVDSLLRVALALRLPIETLISPLRIAALEKEIERRRSALGGDAQLDAPPAPKPERRMLLAASYRAGHLVMALSDGKLVLEIRGHRIPANDPRDRMRTLIEREARVQGLSEVIVESGTKASKCLAPSSIPRREITFDRAKQRVSGEEDGRIPKNKPFFKSLVERHPELAKYVKVLPLTRNIAMTERWRTARLVAATIVLAAAAAGPVGATMSPLLRAAAPRQEAAGAPLAERTARPAPPSSAPSL